MKPEPDVRWERAMRRLREIEDESNARAERLEKLADQFRVHYITHGSRLDVGDFTAAEIQTMARFAGVPVDAARRLVECAVQIGKLPRKQVSRSPIRPGESLQEWSDRTDVEVANARAIAHAPHGNEGYCICGRYRCPALDATLAGEGAPR